MNFFFGFQNSGRASWNETTSKSDKYEYECYESSKIGAVQEKIENSEKGTTTKTVVDKEEQKTPEIPAFDECVFCIF